MEQMISNPLYQYLLELNNDCVVDEDEIPPRIAKVFFELWNAHVLKTGFTPMVRKLLIEIHECILDSKHPLCTESKLNSEERCTLLNLFKISSKAAIVNRWCSKEDEPSRAIFALCSGNPYDENLCGNFIKNLVLQFKNGRKIVKQLIEKPMVHY